MPSLKFCWRCLEIGLLTLPLLPSLGAIFIGLALLLTWLHNYQIIIRRPLNWGFALLSVLFVISAGFAFNQTEALLGLFNFLPFFIAFAGFSSLIQQPSQLRRISWILVITSVPVIVMGWGQLFWGWTTPKQWQSLLGWAIASGGNPPGRMASVFMYANSLACYLTMVFILGLGLWLEAYGRLVAQLSQGKPNIYRYPLDFIFLSVMAIANLSALILTNSRNAWAIALVACLVYAIYQGWRILVAGVTGIAATIAMAAFAPTPIAQVFRTFVPSFFWARLNDQMYPDRPLALMRTTQWDFAANLTWQRPLTGWGLRNFTQLYQAQMDIWLGHPHNLFLMLSAETGLPATLLFCGLFVAMAIASIQVLQNPTMLTSSDQVILLSYILFLACLALFNTVDVSIFDFRVNVFSWVLLSGIAGFNSFYKGIITVHQQGK
jgi:O-antigen ligase